MRNLAEIVDAFEAELELENELGVRLFSCDRSLLAVATTAGRKGLRPLPAAAGKGLPALPVAAGKGLPALPTASNSAAPDFVFLHHAPLTPDGVVMMSKIITALGKRAEVPILFEEPRPKTPYAVVLGGAALKKWFPNINSEAGRWVKAQDGTWLYVTYSPTYLLRFGDSAQVLNMKRAMWKGLKALMRRIEDESR